MTSVYYRQKREDVLSELPDLIENRDFVDGNLPAEYMLKGFSDKSDWKSTCKECKGHNY